MSGFSTALDAARDTLRKTPQRDPSKRDGEAPKCESSRQWIDDKRFDDLIGPCQMQHARQCPARRGRGWRPRPSRVHTCTAMGYWVNTTFIHCGDLDAVGLAMAGVFAAERMIQVEAPPPRERLLVEPLQYDTALHNDLWALALFPGAPGWCVVKTAPLELLGEAIAANGRMRIAPVCERLGCTAIQVHVYDSTGMVIAEAGADGSVAVSGFNPGAAADPLEWNGQRIPEECYLARPHLHDVGAGFDIPDDNESAARTLAARLAGDNAAFCDNSVSTESLIRHLPVDVPGARSMYFRHQGSGRQRFRPAASWADYQAQVGAGG